MVRGTPRVDRLSEREKTGRVRKGTHNVNIANPTILVK